MSSENDEITNTEDQNSLDDALTSIGILAMMSGLSIYNSYKLQAIQGYDGEIVEWVAHPELSVEGPCEYCNDMDTEQFTVDDAPYLPAHVNCTCELAFVSDADTDDLYNMDDFKDYQAWRDSAHKALRKLKATWTEGGPGSGHYGHQGVPGERGGSAPSGDSALVQSAINNVGLTDNFREASFILPDGRMLGGVQSYEHASIAEDAYDSIATGHSGTEALESFMDETNSVRVRQYISQTGVPTGDLGIETMTPITNSQIEVIGDNLPSEGNVFYDFHNASGSERSGYLDLSTPNALSVLQQMSKSGSLIITFTKSVIFEQKTTDSQKLQS